MARSGARFSGRRCPARGYSLGRSCRRARSFRRRDCVAKRRTGLSPAQFCLHGGNGRLAQRSRTFRAALCLSLAREGRAASDVRPGRCRPRRAAGDGKERPPLPAQDEGLRPLPRDRRPKRPAPQLRRVVRAHASHGGADGGFLRAAVFRHGLAYPDAGCFGDLREWQAQLSGGPRQARPARGRGRAALDHLLPKHL